MKALGGFLMTDDLERRTYVCNARNLHRPHNAFLADTVGTTVDYSVVVQH